MRLVFYGAAREVTGSCHCVEANGRRYLIDCGLRQGADNGLGQEFAFHPGEIDCVVVTHAHIDHSGRLPLLLKQGYEGKIYATGPTCDLLQIMLRDSAHIQEAEAKWRVRKQRRTGDEGVRPLYSMEDAEQVFPLLTPCVYGDIIELGAGVKIRFTDAGHLLGSAYVEMWLTERGITKKVAFSGDIGNTNHPIIREPGYISEADIVVMESTYGDRLHEASFDTAQELAKIIDTTLAKGGNVIIPSFAIGRTQELLYYIREIKERGLVASAPDFPVYLDSPLASAATKIYSGGLDGYLDEETEALIRAGGDPISFPGLRLVETAEESKGLNDDIVPKVIISSSGMCEAGRIRHHLKHNLWRRECSVVFTGFQALGTLGRIIVDGETTSVTLFGEEIAILCNIHNLRSMSSHADRSGLLKWIGAFDPPPERVFVVHGENMTSKSFCLRLVENGLAAVAPKPAAIYDLITGERIFEGHEPVKRGERSTARKESPVFGRLMLAGTRLIEVISRNRGGANKDLAKFADQIDALAKKWDR